MIPISLDPAALRLGLAGRGRPALRRLEALRRGGAAAVTVFSDDTAVFAGAGARASCRLPSDGDIAALDVLWIAGLPYADAAELAAAARARRVLVNVEDQTALCDFHSVAEVRRGDLLLTVSTGGKSPALAAMLRAVLARQFGPEWTARMRQAAVRRGQWRDEGHNAEDVAALTDALLQSAGWL
jgi:precorrin-2 dehydrogenase/sirohydrochlorin ferrochelatase